tara:strand:- start:71357 stop:71500 length:144 start_codon:yes stop_codon:yes gene_type:complete
MPKGHAQKRERKKPKKGNQKISEVITEQQVIPDVQVIKKKRKTEEEF